MMTADFHTTLALPLLDDAIPAEYRVPGDSGLCAPLALALLESPILSDKMFRLGPNALLADVFTDLNERDLASRALTAWWDQANRKHPCRHFKWNLVVADKIAASDGEDLQIDFDHKAWFCIGRSSKVDVPRFSLAQAVEQLEGSLEGFGQTVMAVLFDALAHLPESLCPWHAHTWAEFLHWSESEDDAGMIKLAKKNGYAVADLLTRERFFKGMPLWVVRPQRVVSREAIVRAARVGIDRDVIAACDAISELARSPGFEVGSGSCGTQHTGLDSYEACVVLAWRAFDRRGDVIDEWLNMIGQSGEAIDSIDINRVPLTSQDLQQWMRRTEHMLHLAQLTERLIVLIGEPF